MSITVWEDIVYICLNTKHHTSADYSWSNHNIKHCPPFDGITLTANNTCRCVLIFKRLFRLSKQIYADSNLEKPATSFIYFVRYNKIIDTTFEWK